MFTGRSGYTLSNDAQAGRHRRRDRRARDFENAAEGVADDVHLAIRIGPERADVADSPELARTVGEV